MSIELDKNGNLVIPLDTLLQNIPADKMPALVDSLACQDAVIEQVAKQLLDGWTDMMSHGYTDGDKAEPTCPLSKWRRELAMRAGEVAAKEIKDLVEALKDNAQQRERADKWAWQLYHAWPEHMRRHRPEHPKIEYGTAPYMVVRRDTGKEVGQPCKHDTDGDGNCHLCARNPGGCLERSKA